MRVELKTAIFATGRTQRELAAATRIPENRLSAIVRGWIAPREAERYTLAGALGRRVEDLFRDEVVQGRELHCAGNLSRDRGGA